MTAVEAKAQALNLWSLNVRSWYGYALNGATHCAWLPSGVIEQLPRPMQMQLAKEQIRIGVPTLLEARNIPEALRTKLLPVKSRFWLTALAWKGLLPSQQTYAVKSWFKQNQIHLYQSLRLGDLPPTARAEIERVGYARLLNHYAPQSGANCLAAAAGAVAGGLVGSGGEQRIRELWLHAEAFLEFLNRSGYRRSRSQTPKQGDVLVFSLRRRVVHAAYFLGDGLYFEKPGQDFYEPYRVDAFANWQNAWPQANLSLWRSERT